MKKKTKVTAAYFTIIALLLISVPTVHHINLEGTSMLPNYSDGDNLLCITLPDTEYKVGDVVVIEEMAISDDSVMHRIIERSGDEITAKGDNNAHKDPSTDIKNVKCEVVYP